ncbi:MAG: translation elongation factor Ts [Parcubacteria group bacterium]|nr:translation elongation factor Ts [Parcubacteria group bacterium]
MTIKPSDIKELREKTDAGIMDCKEALNEAGGDFDKAEEILRKKGVARASKRAGRDAGEGTIEAYIHSNNKIGVLLELGCETDFVAKNDEFKTLAHDIAMQVAASNPKFVSPDNIPESDLEKEKKEVAESLKDEKKPKEILDKIVEGKLKKHCEEISLIKLPLVKDPDMTIEDLITEKSSKFGEKIKVRRFVRYEI